MALGKGLNSLIPQNKSRKTIRKQTGNNGDSGEKVWQIPLSEIVPNTEQPRRDFSHQDLENLVVSIKKHGILQPITVTEKDDGGYELIAGERRLRASQIAGLATVPALVRSATQQEKLELALIENIQRQNLNPIEEAFAYARLMDEFGLTQEEVAEQVGKARSTVANFVRLLDLPEEVQKALVDGKLSAGKAKALLSLKDEKEQKQVFDSMMGESMTVRDVERTVASKGSQSRKGSVRRDPNLVASEQLLEDRLGTKVHITGRGDKGTIVIDYYSKDELKKLISELS
ncbi:MAG: ParB/RepB/Spo0J family partition protein [Candidatus Magasanikbacteria bacterium]|mgnify:CR=1 FL=1|jgi:ParB family transcriptional regulator, chromosome partitioning protein|nr:ParB/RepB/Spo0J family partition protein [Candidatus Magasanikbacteria bacterium]MBT4314621.1 ParB/RepB/Spo0J family partition protein [Candidatus Magasanikbacteria bacterium]MBT4547042.1 ParB/RepB/Spo0J family partition protein [Candidatus Magasanikbacteria bacterium]MBT6819502.1 ParB/RepB/Spo0J family partition protein [Candidatus Magasanikbacteria bacterium]